ncbi:MAG: CRTAC1 family protein [Acidobacteriia bacterium]|nr:CRTAC1 family protein [Terriglobia bacterium]
MRTLVLLLLLRTTCLSQIAPVAPIPRFEDISQRAGITAPHISSPEKKYIVETVSGGVGFIDCDNDGKLDIVVVNGSTVDRFHHGGDPLVTLYHQDADLKFTDITKSAGLLRRGWGMGVAVADYDNDGWQDLFVTGFGVYALYRNLGNCKFEDVTEKTGLNVGGFGQGAAWGDYDRDGNVDIFVARYLRLDIDHLPEFGSPQCTIMSVKVHCGPLGLPGETNFLFRNRGNGTFEDVTNKAGVDNSPGAYGMQPLWFDYDNDGWPDLYVSNDAGPNYLYRNKHDGTFEDVSLISGSAVDGNGKQQGSMGVDAADIDHDGLLDLFVPDYAFQYDTLYWNRGPQGFEDITTKAHLAAPTYPFVGWGTGFFDLDNDGWDDILITNGHVYPQADSIPGSAPYREPIQLFRNLRDRTFEDVTAIAGLDKLRPASWRGVAFGDVNNDGKVDVLVLDADGPPVLLINRTVSTNHAALFHLIGTKSNKAAIGARVTVKAGDFTQFNEVRGGASLFSQNDLRLHFGLAGHTLMNRVEISWPSGKKDTFDNLAPDFIYTMVEGEGIKQKLPFTTENPQPGK